MRSNKDLNWDPETWGLMFFALVLLLAARIITGG